jgi:uncharacterized membrane protein SpoIIM required for sporulation/ABC-type transport system involved in multi-copper enzyme maturation permease subunit
MASRTRLNAVGPGEARRWWDRQIAPSLVVTRREIRDTLRDWRLVVPIVVLVSAFPLLANFVARAGVDYVSQHGADIIVERLFPFLMLVVGFFPSTFSLVIGLETFVGEKERHSLEPLLSAPLTDLQLYVGKLLAATVPPVFASYLGMLVYTLLLGFTVGWRPSASLLLLAWILSTVTAVVMVAGAVIVSSQSTSVRAANLLASFIILPMALLLQAEAALLLYAQYTALWLIVLALLIVAVLLVRFGIRVFNREQLLGHELDHLNLRVGLRTFWKALWPHDGLVALYTREIPAIVRGLRAELIMVLLVLVVGGVGIGLWAAQRFPLPLTTVDLQVIGDRQAMEELISASGLLPRFSPGAILLNNVRSLIVAAMLALMSLGTLALMLLLVPLAVVAYAGFLFAALGVDAGLLVAVAILPHGLFELPAAILATAQAMRMGDIILQPPDEGGGVLGVVREMGHFAKLFVAVVLPLLALAAWIEVYVTPQALLWFINR